jgi:hypothetical protein
MSSTVTPEPAKQFWGVYHTDREYAREMGDPLRSVVEASTKAVTEELAAALGFDATWAHPVSSEVARSLGFNSSLQRRQTQKVESQSSRLILRQPTTAQLRTTIEVLVKLGKRINEHTAHSVKQLPESPQGENFAAQIKVQTIEKTTRIKTVSEQLKNWREESLKQQKKNISSHV